MVDSSSFQSKPVQAGDAVTITSVGGENSTTTFRQLSGSVQIKDAIYYSTNYAFMAAGIASTVLCVILVVPSFWRYGELGRDVTLGPIEVASAFRAPMLTEGRSNAKEAGGDIKELLKDVGGRKVMYGFVEEHHYNTVNGSDDGVVGNAEPGAGGNENGNVKRHASVRLEIAQPERVRPVSGVWSPPTSPSPRSPGLRSPRLGGGSKRASRVNPQSPRPDRIVEESDK